MKRYPKNKEQNLAARVAKDWLNDALDIVQRGEDPASLEQCAEEMPYHIASYIYDYEHQKAGGEGYYLSIAAKKRILRSAKIFIQEDLELLEFAELWMHLKGKGRI